MKIVLIHIYSEEEDDETMEWEQEQLRRGGHLVDENIERAPIKQVYKPASSKQFLSLFTSH